MALDVSGARMIRMTKLKLSTLLLIALVASACATGGRRQPPAGTTEPDKFLFDRGTENIQRKRWIYAREYFRQLVDSYPTSRYRADAKLGIGDSYLGERSAESYVLAINEYREFLNFYPTHERAHYAQYQLAMAYFNQMRSPMRDQTETRDAIRELNTYIARYADKPLIGEARQKLREAKDRLADWDVGVAVHYYRIKWYPGAVGRLMPLISGPTADPEYTRRDAVYYYLGESLLKVQRPAEALPYFERLIKEFEQSEYLDDAQKRVAEIKAANPAIAK
jgi:outer membrane protein assembly factor BamD